jgi:hypothetical protein
MLKLLAPALAVLVIGAAVPGHAAEISPRKMIDQTCTAYRDDVTARPKTNYMTRADQFRLKSEESMLRFGRAKHSDVNTYYKDITLGRTEAPVLDILRSSKRLGNKGCAPAATAR